MVAPLWLLVRRGVPRPSPPLSSLLSLCLLALGLEQAQVQEQAQPLVPRQPMLGLRASRQGFFVSLESRMLRLAGGACTPTNGWSAWCVVPAR